MSKLISYNYQSLLSSEDKNLSHRTIQTKLVTSIFNYTFRICGVIKENNCKHVILEPLLHYQINRSYKT